MKRGLLVLFIALPPLLAVAQQTKITDSSGQPLVSLFDGVAADPSVLPHVEKRKQQLTWQTFYGTVQVPMKFGHVARYRPACGGGCAPDETKDQCAGNFVNLYFFQCESAICGGSVPCPCYPVSTMLAQNITLNTTHNAEYGGMLPGGNPNFQNGYLITHHVLATQDSPSVRTFDANGTIAVDGVVWVEGAQEVELFDATVSPGGKVFASGRAIDSAGKVSFFIAALGKDGHVVRLMRTSPFVPSVICAANDDTVWAFGQHIRARDVGSYARLHLYNMSTPWDAGRYDFVTWGPGVAVASPGDGMSNLACMGTKMYVYQRPQNLMLSVDTATGKTYRAQVDSIPQFTNVTGFAVATNGDIYASMEDSNMGTVFTGAFKLLFTGPNSAKWIEVPGTVTSLKDSRQNFMLLGIHGDKLVYRTGGNGKVSWADLP
ncbi:MAG TPA: hypothetical protein VK473_06690 [Terriglobales bacterium]|nr:hypothetical protein [Terriglobales bacterium]